MSNRYIYLKNGDEIIKQQQFGCANHRQAIIDNWKKLYGRKFNDLVVQEEPKPVRQKKGRPKATKYAYGHMLFNSNKCAGRKNINMSRYKD